MYIVSLELGSAQLVQLCVVTLILTSHNVYEPHYLYP